MSAPGELPVEFGRYRVLRKIGEGGMGAVYLAEDSKLGRRVALKVPHFSAEDRPTAIERFHREARVAAAIEHPNICPVYDIGEVNGVHYLTMPYIEGVPLSQKVDPNRPVCPAEAVALVRRLALAVGVMHERGLIHRDLKPGNVLLRTSGDPVIMDFGLARSISGTGRLTATGAAVGTPAYMSPEQIRGETELGPATDVYSLGVILFEMLTGRLPFVGTFHAVYGQILHAAPPAPSQLRPGLDPRLDAICLNAMAKAQAGRYASVREFAAALAGYLATAAASLPTTTAHAPFGPPAASASGPVFESTALPAAPGAALARPGLIATTATTNPPPVAGAAMSPPVSETIVGAAVGTTVSLQHLRRVAFLDRLTRLLKLHEASGFLLRTFLYLVVAVGLVTAVSGLVLHGAGLDRVSIFAIGLSIAATPIWLLWRIPKWQARARDRSIDQITEAYGEELRQVGGAPVLHEPAMLREVVRILKTDKSRRRDEPAAL